LPSSWWKSKESKLFTYGGSEIFHVVYVTALIVYSYIDYPYMSLVPQACKIVEGQRYTKRLNEKQITSLLKVTCQRPRDRENDILRVIIGVYI
jgi:hypothetical protein